MRTTLRGTLSRFAAWFGKRLPAFGRNKTPEADKISPSRASPGLEKDQNRRARLAMRYGLLPACYLPNFWGNWTCADPKILLPAAFRNNAECRVECESTPTLLWMSSNKPYIWYFTLHYGNLLSKQWAIPTYQAEDSKGFGERCKPEDPQLPE
jgi:hypothetical protein